jgi:hypothetical protein
MQYEALYAAVIGAAPTVLIGYVIEHRLNMTRYRRVRTPKELWSVCATINCTFWSAVLSLIFLISDLHGVYYPLAVICLLTVGLMGLTVLLLVNVLLPPRGIAQGR